MKKSKKIMLCLAQCAIIALFIILAAGSTEEELAAAGQGASCGSQGYTFVGYYSNADCPSACRAKGYSAYCTGVNTTACFCK